MELGIFARTFARPTLEAVLDAIGEQGLRCVQFNLSCAGLPTLPERIDPALGDQVRQAHAERGLRLAAISGTYNMAHPDPRQRADGPEMPFSDHDGRHVHDHETGLGWSVSSPCPTITPPSPARPAPLSC